MKKISSLLPDNILNKSILIKNLNQFVNNNFPQDIAGQIEIINIKGDVIVVGCKNSSIATVLKFERNKYLDIFRKNNSLNIADFKIVINN